MKKFIYTLTIFSLASCSYFSRKGDSVDAIKLKSYKEMELVDYIEHLNSFKANYVKFKGTNVHFLSYNDKKYLESLVVNLYKKNELFFENREVPNFYVVNDNRPFHFSLPDKSIFLSSGLLKKYIKSEKLLYCIIAFELIRSEKKVYKKSQIIPTGAMDTTRILSLLRLNTNVKVEIHKWAFYILKRIGIDTDNYLAWLQIQNRNSVDFSTQLGEIGSISREEALFKSFVIKNSQRRRSTTKYERSSRGFYNFMNKIKG